MMAKKLKQFDVAQSLSGKIIVATQWITELEKQEAERLLRYPRLQVLVEQMG